MQVNTGVCSIVLADGSKMKSGCAPLVKGFLFFKDPHCRDNTELDHCFVYSWISRYL